MVFENIRPQYRLDARRVKKHNGNQVLPILREGAEKQLKYNPAEQLGMMWNFLKMGNQKANIPLLKEYVYDLIQLMTQKTAGQRGNKADISFDDIETIKNCIVIEAMSLVLSGKLEDIKDDEQPE